MPDDVPEPIDLDHPLVLLVRDEDVAVVQSIGFVKVREVREREAPQDSAVRRNLDYPRVFRIADERVPVRQPVRIPRPVELLLIVAVAPHNLTGGIYLYNAVVVRVGDDDVAAR